MASGICLINFSDFASPDEIKEAVDKIYIINEKVIKGMNYVEFKDDSMLLEIMNFIKKQKETK